MHVVLLGSLLLYMVTSIITPHDMLTGRFHYRLDIFVCGDQIRKGASLNAIQIAEKLL